MSTYQDIVNKYKNKSPIAPLKLSDALAQKNYEEFQQARPSTYQDIVKKHKIIQEETQRQEKFKGLVEGYLKAEEEAQKAVKNPLITIGNVLDKIGGTIGAYEKTIMKPKEILKGAYETAVIKPLESSQKFLSGEVVENKEFESIKSKPQTPEEEKAKQVGEFLGWMVPYSGMAKTTKVGLEALNLAPKVAKYIPAISDAVGFLGTGQILHEEGSRLEQLRNDIIALGVFKAASKAFGLIKDKALSKTINEVGNEFKETTSKIKDQTIREALETRTTQDVKQRTFETVNLREGTQLERPIYDIKPGIEKLETKVKSANEVIKIETGKTAKEHIIQDLKPGTVEEYIESKGIKLREKENDPIIELQKWTHAAQGEKPKINMGSIEKLGEEYKPKKTVTLYRGVEEGEALDFSRPTSWTYNKELAKEHTYGTGRVLARKFTPDEILLDSTELPSKIQRSAGFFEEEAEVIIKPERFSALMKELPSGAISKISIKEVNMSDEIIIALKDVSKKKTSYLRLPLLAEKMPNGKYDIVNGKHRLVEMYQAGKREFDVITDERLYRRLAAEEEKRLIRVSTHERTGTQGIKEYMRRPAKFRMAKAAGPKIFQGLSNLSTKLLEKFKGMLNEITEQQFREVLNRVEKEGIKKVEKDLIVSLAETQLKEKGKINLTQLAKDIEEQLLPLTPTEVKSPRWSNIGEDFIGDGKYGEIVYQSPIKTSAGDVHFMKRGTGNIEELTRVERQRLDVLVQKNISNTMTPQENAEWVQLVAKKQGGNDFPNYFSHIRYEDMADGKTRKILETQSDLMQKDNFALEKTPYKSVDYRGELHPELKKDAFPFAFYEKSREGLNLEDLDRLSKEFGLSKKDKPWLEEWLGKVREDTDKYKSGAIGLEKDKLTNIAKNELRIQQIIKIIDDLPEKVDETIKEKIRKQELQKLESYSSSDPLAQLRTFREEVKRAAKDGKNIILIPSGETAMKIEGLGDRTTWRQLYDDIETPAGMRPSGSGKLTPDKLEVGARISRDEPGFGNQPNYAEQDQWIITDVLGDGKFKANTKIEGRKLVDGKIYLGDVALGYNKIVDGKAYIGGRSETFDISGKVDIKHFVYKLNEEAIPREARKMGLTVEGKIKIDNGEWWKIQVSKEAAKQPTIAFRIKDDLAGVGIKITDAQEEEIIALNKKMFGDTNVKITGQILANKEALGSYQDGIIKILKGQADAKDTFYHEAVHKYLDVFTDKAEHIEILKEAQKLYKLNDFSEVEEKLAEDFIQYARTREGASGKIKVYFDKIIQRIKSYLGNESKIDSLYSDIVLGKKVVEVPQSKLPIGEGELKANRLEARMKDLLDKNQDELKELGVSMSKTMNDKDTIKKATKYVLENKNEAMEVLEGKRPTPNGLNEGSIYVALNQQAIGDQELALKLMGYTAKRAGQNIQILSQLNPHSPVKYMTNLVNSKIEIVGGKEKVAQYIKRKVEGGAYVFKKSNLTNLDWNEFISSIRC